MTVKILAVSLMIAAAGASGGCASTKVKPKELAATAKSVADASGLRDMSCEDLAKARVDLAKKVAEATVKPTAVDFTNPADIPKVKELNPPKAALSVAMTTLKSTIPGAGFAPLVTGSAFRSAYRDEAIDGAKQVVSKLDGVLIGKGCAPAEEPAAAQTAEQPAAATPVSADGQQQPAETQQPQSQQ